jgi:hypothetical protein
MKTLNGMEQTEMLKKQFLQCFAAPTRAASLRDLVKRLVEQGVSPATLFRWCVNAGHRRKTVSGRLSRIFCALGLRTRKKGGGRKPSPDAVKVVEYMRGQFGEGSLKVLYAAVREWKAQAAEASPTEPCAAYVPAIHIHPGPALPSFENYCTSTIRNSLTTAKLNNAPHLSIGGTSPEKTSTTTINSGYETCIIRI